MNRRKFISTCICCAFASAGAIFLNEKNKIDSKAFGYGLDRHLGIHIAEHCNLNCKYCFHYSCIAQKEFYDLDKFDQDMAQMSFVFNRNIRGINLMGGEPLLNPNINKYVKITRRYFPKAPIDILTNAVLLDDMDKSFWETLNKNWVSIVPTLYPIKNIKINWASILDKAKKYNITVYGDYKREEQLTIDNIDKFYKNLFCKMALDENCHDKRNKAKCKQRISANCMHNGKLYPCAAMAYVNHLNKKFNTNFKVTKKDYVDLYKVKNLGEVKKFMEQPKQFPFCNYCTVDDGKFKWENSPEHTLSEWT